MGRKMIANKTDASKTKFVIVYFKYFVCGLDCKFTFFYSRYFFTSQEQRCEKFMYSPECHLRLGRSRNVFHTHEVCEKVCKTNADQSLKQSRYLVKRNLDQCLDSLDVGHSCKLSRAVSKWYFDESANECIEFQYLGCGGNANRFNEREDCEECKNKLNNW
ncbi:unnamed protein product [Echinostoma caproni]|uniref:BPTI/Kunitz inhibitor domain-containing protein n=1 Tax=Echinostoma caproni TaxID=27848 RepID=A0A183AMW4_9TREM|nr:unnamed protein product [Echinostoma caproni]